MQRCEHCKLSLKGNYTICPLCGGIIQESGNQEEEVFPLIPYISEFNLFIRIIILISVAIVVISFAVNILFTKNLAGLS